MTDETDFLPDAAHSSYLMPLTLLGAFLALSGCKPPATVATVPAINQGEICEVKGWQFDHAVEAGCKPGKKILFAPASFGNEQLSRSVCRHQLRHALRDCADQRRRGMHLCTDRDGQQSEGADQIISAAVYRLPPGR